MRRAIGLCVCVLAGLSACASPVSRNRRTARVDIEPGGSLDSVPPVFRARVSQLSVTADAVMLFRGDVPARGLSRIGAGVLESSAASKRVPALSWMTSEGAIFIAPLEEMEPATPLTLAALGVGLVSRLRVAGTSLDHVVRRRFPESPLAPSRRWVFCGDPTELADTPSVLEPLGVVGLVSPSADSVGTGLGRCVRVEIADTVLGGTALPPVDVSGTAFEPLPMDLGVTSSGAGPAECRAEEMKIGPGCTVVEDDRLVLRGPAEPILWAMTVGGAAVVAPTGRTQSLVVKGLVPGRSNHVVGTATDGTGLEALIDVAIATGAVRPHVVINEVLANPLGPEPDQEWVELVNDGSSRVNLEGFSLGDGSGSSVLPAAQLEPGQYALVVTEAFDAGEALDVPPRAGTLLLRVAKLGQLGLANSGERLELRSSDGLLISAFPAVPAPKAGVSVARRFPWSLDDSPEDFSPSKNPGATPGSEN